MNVPPLTSQDLITNGLIKYYENLRPETQKGLRRYTTSEYSSLNTLLRDGLNPNDPNHITSYPNEVDWIKHLDKAIAESPKIKEPFHVYRGMVLPEEVTNHIKKSGYLNNRGYTSTTLDIHTAMGFATDSCCLFKVIIPDPQGINYAFIKTNTKGEQEILFQRGTYFKLAAPVYKYKYHSANRPDYRLISLYTVTIHPGMVVPTPVAPQIPIVVNNKQKTLESFTRYIEQMGPDDIDLFYGDAKNIPLELTNDYIRTHPHHTVSEELKSIMLRIARQML